MEQLHGHVFSRFPLGNGGMRGIDGAPDGLHFTTCIGESIPKSAALKHSQDLLLVFVLVLLIHKNF